MRKKLGFFICLAVFLQTIAFAQMQGLISYSSERYSRNIQPESKTVKVEVYDEKNIITLCRDNYYIVAGKYKNTGSLYWFDREHTLQNNNGGCYEIYSAPVYWCSTQPSTTMTYYPSSDVKILNIIPCTASSTPLFIPCSD